MTPLVLCVNSAFCWDHRIRMMTSTFDSSSSDATPSSVTNAHLPFTPSPIEFYYSYYTSFYFPRDNNAIPLIYPFKLHIVLDLLLYHLSLILCLPVPCATSALHMVIPQGPPHPRGTVEASDIVAILASPNQNVHCHRRPTLMGLPTISSSLPKGPFTMQRVTGTLRSCPRQVAVYPRAILGIVTTKCRISPSWSAIDTYTHQRLLAPSNCPQF